PTEIVDKQISCDGTRKYIFKYPDNSFVEAVGMPSLDKKGPKHLTVCFSTQIGCAMACAFCATGTQGLLRNLSAGEMIDQLLLVQKDFGIRISNAVSMGQGEPFQNYDAVLEAMNFFNSKNGFEIGARHMTISTCGILSGIKKLSQDPHQYTLAISLHSATQEKRDYLMPRCANMPLAKLKKELTSYIQYTNRRITFEYSMIQGFNDSEEDLKALRDYCDNLLCHVNLIPINSVSHSPFQPSSKQTLKHWIEYLNSLGVETTIRNSRGSDIDGACGQLINKKNVG
ncbi:MAG: 23S rRNA (adenine(2503)-C(2))-methyltransferase RlmN, partial [Anaerotardibacter sp.]